MARARILKQTKMNDNRLDAFSIAEENESGSEHVEIKADESLVGMRLDKLISVRCNISRSMAVRLIESGCVTVDLKNPGKNFKPALGDLISVMLPEPEPADICPEDIKLDIVYEDDDIIVINKPSGMIVHPAPGVYSGTLVNALMYHCKGSLSGIGGVLRPGIVHRIDKDTSGLIVAAKNDFSHVRLSEQMKTHTAGRVYFAIVHGNIKYDSGTVNKPIGRHPTDRKKMAVITDPNYKSREAVTHLSVIDRYVLPNERFTYIKCELETGRTHQIRVHMSSLCHPLLGDATYNGNRGRFYESNKNIIDGQCLHAKELRLIHPRTGERMIFTCELPDNMRAVLCKLESADMERNLK